MFESLSEMLERTLGRIGLKKEAGRWKIVQGWPQIVGVAIAKVSRPQQVIRGTLYVGTSSSSWASELDFRKTEILSLIRQHLGETGIRDIRFQSTSWKSIDASFRVKIPPKLNDSEMHRIRAISGKIENTALREAFEKVLIQDAACNRRKADR